MRSTALRSGILAPSLAHRGTIVAFDASGAVMVRRGGAEALVACDLLDSGMGPAEYQLGETVLFVLYDQSTGCILGRVTTARAIEAPVRRRSLRLEVEQFEVTARERVTVQTQGARLRLTRGGDLELLGQTLIARARRLQKLLAPILRLN
jgi:hypothetical protein